MIFIYAKRDSHGARALARKLQELGSPSRRVRRLDFIPGPRDLVVAWGAPPDRQLPCKVLGSPLAYSKLTELVVLANEGVPVPQFSLTQVDGWLGRRAFHVGGMDFAHPPVRPDYWVRKLEITREWRLHIFKHGEEFTCIRRAEKVKMEEEPSPHPWVRSHEFGWKLSYNDAPLPKGLRAMAKNAVQVLDLDFGAVDAAQLRDGSILVLEVNRAPGLDEEGETLTRYAQHILQEVA